MLRLYVMRHAKSSWAVPGARDYDRELNERGLMDMEKISRFLAREEHTPARVLCSSAVRTKQTYENIKDAIQPEPSVTFTEKLYSSGLSDYIEMIQSVDEPVSLMVIGHNPMCGALATSLPGQGNEDELAKIAYKYPTGCISIIDFDFDHWQEVSKGNGVLVKSVFPSEL